MKKNILFMTPHLGGGGAEKVIVDVLNNIDTEKFDITLVLLQKRGIHLNNLKANIGIKYLVNDNKISIKIQELCIKFIPKIYYKIMIRDKYDIEVSFLEGWTTKLIANSSNNKSKKIAWVHIDLMKKHWTNFIFFNLEEERCYNKFDDIVFVSSDAKNSFIKLFDSNKSSKHVIYNPIMTEEINKKANEFDISFNLFTVLSVGRLEEQKGFDRLIKAHSNIVKDYPHQLVILGDGDERESLIKLIDKNGVNDSVKLIGYKENPYPYIKASDLFVCSSRAEGFSLVVAEAISLEKPILSTRVSGPIELLNNGEYGYLCENSKEGIENGLKEMLANKEYIKYYSDKCKERKRRFNYKKIIKQIESLLEI